MPSKKTIERQYQLIMPHMEAANKYMTGLLRFLPSADFTLETNIKPLNSVIHKMEERKEKNLLHLSDLARGRLFYSDNYTQNDVFKLLKQIAKDKIIKVDPKKEKHFGLKYKGVLHLDFQIGLIIFELQIVPMEFKPFKKLLHRIYEKLRNENHLTKQQKEKLQEIHNALYDDLMRKAKENRKDL